MKAILASIFVAMLLSGCGGGGGDAGTCAGSPEYCAQFAANGGDGQAGTGGIAAPGALAFTKSGTGNLVFDLPANVTRLRIQATFSGPSHTFSVNIGGTPLVRTTIGSSHTPPSFEGIFAGPGGATVDIFDASGVDWVVTQLLTEQ